MLKKETIAAILLLAALSALLWWLGNGEDPGIAAPTPEITREPESFLIAPDEIVTRIAITAQSGEFVEVRRKSNGAWAVRTREIAATNADPAQAEAAASQVVAIRLLGALENPPATSELGLQPAYFSLIIDTQTQENRVFYIGDVSPSGQGYYAQDAQGKIFLVSRVSIDALLNLLYYPPFAPAQAP